MATVADLGARTLRRLGFSLVPQSLRAAPDTPMSANAVAALALRDLGIPVAETDRPASLAPVSPATVASAALRLIGIGQSTANNGTTTQQTIASRALRAVGVNPVDIGSAVSAGGVSSVATLARRTLLKLSVIDSDEPPSIPDLSDANVAVVSVHEELVARDYVAWPVGAVPDAAADYYVILAANMMAPQFGKQASQEVHVAAMEMLRQQSLTGVVAQARAMDKVAAVHAEMAEQGWVDWPLSAIPTAASEPYVDMTAQLLGPTYGKPMDPTTYGHPAAYGAAQMRVRLTAMAGTLGQAVAQAKVSAVHEALNVQGLVSWPLTAIPVAYADDYAAMASTLISSFAGQSRDPQSRQADLATWDAAQDRVRKGAMIAGMQERVLAKVLAVHSELGAMGISSWSSSQIPASMSDAYAAAAVALMTAEAGKPADAQSMQMAYSRIRMIAMNGPAGQALAEQKVRAVHYGLEAQGRLTWTLVNIPVFAEEPYVQMATALLAPEIGMKSDPEMAMMGDRALRLATVLPATRAPVRVDYF